MNPLITPENLVTANLDDWVEEFHFLYERQDQRRSEMGIWIQVVQHSSKLAEAIRLEDYGDCLEHLARCFCWVCSFVGKCTRAQDDSPYKFRWPLSAIVFRKYPNLCPACAEKPCKCPVDRYMAEHRTAAYKQALKEKLKARNPWQNEQNPMQLERFVGMFGGIYGGAHYGLPVETIGFHFLEEIGEVANGIRRVHEGPDTERGDNLELLQNEIADVISWTCSLVLKLRQYVGVAKSYVEKFVPEIRHFPDPQTTITLSRIVWDLYGRDSKFLICPICRKRPCEEKVPEEIM